MAAAEPPNDSAAEFERLAAQRNDGPYELCLYVSGMTPRSTEAINNLQGICEQHLGGESNYVLKIIDLYKHPELAEVDQVIATPTLIKRQPAPVRRLVGTLSNKESVLAGLDLIRR